MAEKMLIISAMLFMFYLIVRNLAGEIAQEYMQRQVGLLANLNIIFSSFHY